MIKTVNVLTVDLPEKFHTVWYIGPEASDTGNLPYLVWDIITIEHDGNSLMLALRILRPYWVLCVQYYAATRAH